MRIVRTVAAAVFGVALAVPLGGAPAWAHNSLTAAEPAKNAILTKAPERIRLTFLQKPDDTSMTVTVTGAEGRPVPLGAMEVDGTATVATITEPLDNGAYTVTYRVVSRDGHPVQGSYRFTVDDPAAAPAAISAAPPTSAAPAPADEPAARTVAGSSDDSGRSAAWLAAIGATLVVGGLVLVILRRRSSRTPQ
jgi:methionine-rich copper-binding protein CopC